MLAAAESQWSSEAQQPISEWTCTSWAEAVPLPWTSMTTSASSGRDPTGWSSSASTSSPDRWHSWFSSYGQVSDFWEVEIISNSQWLFVLQGFNDIHNNNRLLQALEEKHHTGFGSILFHSVHSPPSLPYPAKIGNVHRIYSTHWSLSPTPAVRRAADYWASLGPTIHQAPPHLACCCRCCLHTLTNLLQFNGTL